MPTTRSQRRKQKAEASPLPLSDLRKLFSITKKARKHRTKGHSVSSLSINDTSIALENVYEPDMSTNNSVSSVVSEEDTNKENSIEKNSNVDQSQEILDVENVKDASSLNVEDSAQNTEVLADKNTTGPTEQNRPNVPDPVERQQTSIDETSITTLNTTSHQGAHGGARPRETLNQDKFGRCKNGQPKVQLQDQYNRLTHPVEQVNSQREIPEVEIKQNKHYIDLCEAYDLLQLTTAHEIQACKETIKNLTAVQTQQVDLDKERLTRELEQANNIQKDYSRNIGLPLNNPSAPVDHPMAQAVKFENFAGGDEEDIVTWNKTLKRNLKFLAWPEYKCLDFIPTLLKDKALKFYESLSEPTLSNLNALLEALETKFSHKRRGILHINALMERHQMANESVAEYTKEMNKNFTKLQISDPFTTMTAYTRGLRPDISNEVIKLMPDSLEKCEEIALVIESANKNSNSISESVEKAVAAALTRNIGQKNENPRTFAVHQSGDPYCRRCSCSHPFGQHIIQPIGPNQTRAFHQQQARPTGTYNFSRQRSFRRQGQNNTQPQQYYPQQQNQRQNTQHNGPIRQPGPNITCYNCKRPGHIARECRQQHLN